MWVTQYPRLMACRLSSSHEIRPLEAIFDGIVHQVPGAVGRLHSSTSSSPTFLHPRYIELLLDLASRLDSEDAGVVIDYYQREYLCLPFTSGWIKNIWKLIGSFYLPVSAMSMSSISSHRSPTLWTVSWPISRRESIERRS